MEPNPSQLYDHNDRTRQDYESDLDCSDAVTDYLLLWPLEEPWKAACCEDQSGDKEQLHPESCFVIGWKLSQWKILVCAGLVETSDPNNLRERIQKLCPSHPKARVVVVARWSSSSERMPPSGATMTSLPVLAYPSTSSLFPSWKATDSIDNNTTTWIPPKSVVLYPADELAAVGAALSSQEEDSSFPKNASLILDCIQRAHSILQLLASSNPTATNDPQDAHDVLPVEESNPSEETCDTITRTRPLDWATRHSFLVSHLLRRQSFLPSKKPRGRRRDRQLVDSLLGMILAILCIRWSLSAQLLSFRDFLLQDSRLQWLETFPVGFKLNVPLTLNMGREIRNMLLLRQWIFEAVVAGGRLLLNTSERWWISLAAALLGLGLGASGTLALWVDLLRLLTMDIGLLADVFRRVYRAEVYLLGALWRLFRGKKRNVLRNRTDTMEYDSMQLVLGTLLFAVALFLYTTVLVYYAFFTALQLLVNGMVIVVWVGHILVTVWLERNPATAAAYRSVYMDLDRDPPVLVVTYKSKWSLLGESLGPYCGIIKSWFGVFLCEVATGGKADLSSRLVQYHESI